MFAPPGAIWLSRDALYLPLVDGACLAISWGTHGISPKRRMRDHGGGNAPTAVGRLPRR